MVAVGTSLPRREIVDEFQRLWYGEAVGSDHTYFGLRMPRCPLDMAIYAEVVHGLGPGLIIETSTDEGASALQFAHLLDQLGHGRVLSIDLGSDVDAGLETLAKTVKKVLAQVSSRA